MAAMPQMARRTPCGIEGFNRYGENAGISEGGRITALATEGGQVLGSYESPRGRQGAGSVAGNGTMFFVPIGKFLSMTPRYDALLASRGHTETTQVTVWLFVFIERKFTAKKFLKTHEFTYLQKKSFFDILMEYG